MGRCNIPFKGRAAAAVLSKMRANCSVKWVKWVNAIRLQKFPPQPNNSVDSFCFINADKLRHSSFLKSLI